MNTCCRFGAALNGLSSKESEPWDEILFSSTNFVALPTLGALIEGWLLIAPRQHALCVGALPPNLLGEFREFREEVVSAIRAAYGATVYFEHGPSKDGNVVGCGVNHAHVHLLPWVGRWKDAVDAFAPVSLAWRRISSLENLCSIHVSGDDYLYFEEADGEAWIASGSNIPSQFFRRIIASATGQAGRFDWKSFNGEQFARMTVETLRPECKTDLKGTTQFAPT